MSSRREFFHRPWFRWAALFLFCTIAGLFFGTQLYLSTMAWGKPTSFQWALTARLWAWYQWGLWGILVWWLGTRVPLRLAGWKKAVPFHLAVSLAIAFLQIAVNTWTHLTFVEDPTRGFTYAGYLQGLLLFAFHRNFLIYWTVLGGQLALRTYRELKQQELTSARLESKLVEARLEALKMQLRPHFLFNTLNAITALVRRDPPRAERLINDLSELLRLTLADVDSQLVPLARECEILDRYIDIQRVRFGEKLRVRREFDPSTLALLVPNLILQPLVENAIQYAVAERYEGGEVTIVARREGDRLHLEVMDDGPGLSVAPDRAVRAGIGLSNTKERLNRLYGEEQSLTLENLPEGGLAVRVELPLTEAA